MLVINKTNFRQEKVRINKPLKRLFLGNKNVCVYLWDYFRSSYVKETAELETHIESYQRWMPVR